MILVTVGTAPAPPEGAVSLLEPYEMATAADELAEVGSLSAIDPARPTAGWGDSQTLSLFGREDLIADTSRDYRATGCAPRPGARDVTAEIVRRARATSVVIVNESHERSEHRGFTAGLLARLRSQGYSGLAIEALAHPAAGTPRRDLPSFLREPRLRYFQWDDGYYLGEAAFGRLGRTAKALGYALVPYEERVGTEPTGTARPDDIAPREEAQADALAQWLRDHPGRKLVVHVGYNHAREVPQANGDRWMAARLAAKTGVDPLTISQTTCRGGGPARRLAALPVAEPAGSFDLLVDHPTARFVRGRSAWRAVAGDLPVTIPPALRPSRGWRVVEARRDGEPGTAVPMDRVAIRPGEDVALMLPPGRYRLRILDPRPATRRSG